MILQGEKIRLRAIEREDLPRYVQWFAAPEVTENLAMVYPMSRTHEEQWYEMILKAPPEEQPLAIDVHVRGKWRHIGGIGFAKVEWRCRSAEFGVHIGAREFWNKGYGTDAIRTLVRFGFDTLNLNRIWLRVYETNRRAQRVYEKVGFFMEGHLRQAEFRAGLPVDVLLYSILREEWYSRSDARKER